MVCGVLTLGCVLAPVAGVHAAGGSMRLSLADSVAVSRGVDRSGSVVRGEWALDERVDVDRMSVRRASNPMVADLMDGRDRDSVPVGFDPDHPSGDTGDAYAFSQCTWWAYRRRHELGLPVGSHLGDGRQWAAAARALGYWVDRTPRVGDVMVFQPGQEGASRSYGHVAVVERVNADGSVTTSECGASLGGVPMSRTIRDVDRFEFIHY